MPIVEPVPIAPLPVAPFVGDPDFDAHADAHVAALTPHREQVNASAAATYQNALSARDSASSAATSEAQASSAASAASAAAGATKWAPGNYAEGAVVWSPTNGLLYRRKAAGASAADPATPEATAQWWLMGAPLAAPIQHITGNTAAQAGVHYVLGAALTLTMPAEPAVRDVVQVTDLSGSRSAVIATAGKLIRGVAGPLVLDMPSVRLSLVYSGSEKGWI